jgi:hypothetical protein
MKFKPLTRHCLAGLTAALLLVPAAYAARNNEAGMATYRQDVADCNAGRTNQSLHDCLYEARSALRDTRNGQLQSEGTQTLMENELARCQVHPPGDERTACERMARGEGMVFGSVQAGGELKEIITVEPASTN